MTDIHPEDALLNADNTIEFLTERVGELEAEVELLKTALEPFADYADQHSRTPSEMFITPGSRLAKRQLTMGDCYAARRALETKP